MTNKLDFLKKIDDLKELGIKNGFRLSREQVKEFFKPEGLSEEQMNLLGEYLKVKKVYLEGYVPEPQMAKPGRPLEAEELLFQEIYEGELRELRSFDEEEKRLLFSKAQRGEDVTSELSEALLPWAYEEALRYQGNAILLGDLVQEANLALILAISELPKSEGNGQEFLAEKVRFTLDSLLEGEKDQNLEAEKVAGKLNQLLDLIEVLNKEGTDYTVEDIAQGMEVDLSELEELLRIAGEEVEEAEAAEEEMEE